MGSYEDTSWAELRALTRERRAERRAVRYSALGLEGVSSKTWVKRTWFRARVRHCTWCDRPMTLTQLSPLQRTLDHLTPTSRGGEHNFGNWVIACWRCNTAKGDRWPEDFVRNVLPGLIREDRQMAACYPDSALLSDVHAEPADDLHPPARRPRYAQGRHGSAEHRERLGHPAAADPGEAQGAEAVAAA